MTSFGECIPLATTGVQGTLFFLFFALASVVTGVILSVFVRGTRAKVAALSIGFIAALGIGSFSPSPAFADNPSAPVAVSAPTIGATIDIPSLNLTLTQTTPAAWSNTEGCGVLSYQWQIQTISSSVLSSWENSGSASTSVAGGHVVSCNTVNNTTPERARLIVTLTNSYGSAQSTSPEITICPRG